jgi:hypothetical protein
MKIAKSMIQKLEIKLSSDSLGSIQTLYQQIKSATDNYKEYNGQILQHKSLSVWAEEFVVFLADKDPRFIYNLTDLFDCPSKWSYESITRGMEPLENCWITIFGAITPSLLQSKLTMDASGGGLISRIIFVVGYGAIRKIAMPFLSAEDIELQSNLLKDLEQIKLLSGPFEMTQGFFNTYSHWYEQVSDSDYKESDSLMSYHSRRPLHVKKLAMIVSASESDDMIITAEHFKRALSILKYTEHEMPNAFYGIGRGDHADVMADIMRFTEKHKTLSFKDILRRFHLDLLPGDLNNIMDSLVRAGKLQKSMDMKNQTVYEFMHNSEEDNLESLHETYFKFL